MNKKILNFPLFWILILFLSWRILLVIVSVVAIKFVSLGATDKFLGGGVLNYLFSPEVFAWANFDGEHYLSIAINGYKPLEQAFFPIYPILVAFFSKPFAFDPVSTMVASTISGLLISNIAFIFSLIFLWELLREDYPQKVAFLTLIMLLIFPTSFYFGAVYSESIFMLFLILSFYFARKGHWFLATVSGIISSATRVFGVILLPALLLEVYQQKAPFSKAFWIIFIPLGLIGYMFYQFLTVGDPLAFYNLQELVGEQHQSGIILLPQVYFRYIKMLLTVDIHNPIYQTVLLEFAVGIAFFLLPIYGYFKKIRLSYLVYAMFGFLLPTIQGSFSSVPRYVLVLFPAFLAIALWLDGVPKVLKLIICFGLITSLIIETTLFLRGYWVA